MAIHATASAPLATSFPARTGVWLRLRVRFAGPQLDFRLAEGEDPAGDPRLALRAARLTSPRPRRRLATAVEKACRAGRRPGFSAAIPVEGCAVDIARPGMLELAAALRDRDRVLTQGVALAALLLTHAEGPLYRPEHADALDQAARRALLALGPPERAELVLRGRVIEVDVVSIALAVLMFAVLIALIYGIERI